MSPSISIAVVSWNTRELLRRCLQSMEPEVRAGRAEVWVVDNHSSDGSAEMVARDFQWAQLIASEENLGFGSAINLVAARADTPWLAAANADIELRPGALETLLDSGDRHLSAGAIAPRLLLPDGTTQHSVHRFPTVRLALMFALGAHRLVPGLGDHLCLERFWNPERPRWVDWAHGAFLLVRRDGFDAVGGFDAAQWLYAEDLDISWRLSQAGWRVRYEPDARVRHAVAAATRQAFPEEERARAHISASYAWMESRKGRLVARLTAVVNIIGAAARMLLLWPLARIRADRWRPRFDHSRAYVALHRLGLRRQSSERPD